MAKLQKQADGDKAKARAPILIPSQMEIDEEFSANKENDNSEVENGDQVIASQHSFDNGYHSISFINDLKPAEGENIDDIILDLEQDIKYSKCITVIFDGTITNDKEYMEAMVEGELHKALGPLFSSGDTKQDSVDKSKFYLQMRNQEAANSLVNANLPQNYRFASKIVTEWNIQKHEGWLVWCTKSYNKFSENDLKNSLNSICPNITPNIDKITFGQRVTTIRVKNSETALEIAKIYQTYINDFSVKFFLPSELKKSIPRLLIYKLPGASNSQRTYNALEKIAKNKIKVKYIEKLSDPMKIMVYLQSIEESQTLRDVINNWAKANKRNIQARDVKNGNFIIKFSRNHLVKINPFPKYKMLFDEEFTLIPKYKFLLVKMNTKFDVSYICFRIILSTTQKYWYKLPIADAVLDSNKYEVLINTNLNYYKCTIVFHKIANTNLKILIINYEHKIINLIILIGLLSLISKRVNRQLMKKKKVQF